MIDEQKITTKFNVTLEVPDQLLLDLIQNFPEAGQYTFACTKFDYHGKGVKSFVVLQDTETGKSYKLTIPKMRHGMKILLNEVLTGKLPGLQFDGNALFDASGWDSYTLDALVQCALLGEVIYG